MDFRSFAMGPVQLTTDLRPEKHSLSIKAVRGERLTRKFRRVDRKVRAGECAVAKRCARPRRERPGIDPFDIIGADVSHESLVPMKTVTKIDASAQFRHRPEFNEATGLNCPVHVAKPHEFAVVRGAPRAEEFARGSGLEHAGVI